MKINSINVYDLLIILGAIQGLMLAFYLFTASRPHRKASRFLGAFILLFALNSIYFSFEGLGLKVGNPVNPIEYLPLYFSLLIIPLFYLFVLYLIEPNRTFKKWEILLFVPYLLQLVLQLTFLWMSIFNKDTISLYVLDYIRFSDMLEWVGVVYGISVLVISFLKINKFENNILQNYSEVSRVSLRWFRRLLLILFAIWILWSIPTIYEQVTRKASIEIFYPMWIAMSILIYWLGYSMYSKKDLEKAEMFHTETSGNSTKSLSSKTDQYYQNLLEHMKVKQPFLNPDLNLKSLASALDLSTGYLSQIINQNERRNFFDFINSYRIKAVQQNILDPKMNHLSLLGMAYEAGFKSKSTFNLAFKKLTGTTPSKWKKENLSKP